jgi:hypothetical protein
MQTFMPPTLPATYLHLIEVKPSVGVKYLAQRLLNCAYGM